MEDPFKYLGVPVGDNHRKKCFGMTWYKKLKVSFVVGKENIYLLLEELLW